MVKRTVHAKTEAYRIGLLYRSVPNWPAYTASAHTGLLFISPPKRSDFYAASRTGLLWRSSQIRYENRDAPMQSGIV